MIECPDVGIKNHLLRLPRVGDYQKMSAVAQPQLRHLYRDRHPGHLHQLMAPVKLEGFTSIKYQRNINLRRNLSLAPAPIPYMPPNTVIAARITFGLQLLEKYYRSPTLSFGKLPILCQCLLQTFHKCTQNRPRLCPSPVTEGRLLTANRLANCVARNTQFSC